MVAGLLAVATPAHAGTTYVVNSVADPGDGTCDANECTLREAIDAANINTGPDTIHFSIGTGAVTISVGSNLPQLTDPVVIDGATQPGYSDRPLVELSGANAGAQGLGLWVAGGGTTIRGLVINRFTNDQVLIDSSNNTVAANYLGTDAAGTTGLAGSNFASVRLRNGATTNMIGGTTSAERNVIYGRVGLDSGASNNVVQRNNVGVGADGSALGGPGILISSGAVGNSLLANSIAYTSGLGIDLGGDGVTGNDPGDADSGANRLQNFPVLDTAEVSGGSATVSGSLQSQAVQTYRVEFFRNRSAGCDPSGYGEGQSFIDAMDVTTDEGGNAPFTASLGGTTGMVRAGDYITATATDQATGDTSEFSACRQVTAQVTAPSPPTGVSAGAGDSVAEVSWLAPDSSGSSPIDFYMVYPNPNGAGVFVDAPATTTTIGGLDNGTTYTFTVIATNQDGATSAPSDPSNSVTPQSGAAPPETTSADSPPNGNVSTGTMTTSSDPTNTSINTPNGGTVTIGESAMTGTPPSGVTYVGQQVDITAPDATANDPLTFTFITDCSVLPSNVSSCPVPMARATSGFAQAASAPSSRSVTVTDTGYTPNTTTIRQGGTVKWLFSGLQQHSVTDSRGLGASGAPRFNSGSKAPGTSYSHAFSAAGRYTYHSTVPGDTLGSGTVSVPVQVSQASGGAQSTIVITWASSRAAGYRFDVQYRYKAPGSSLYGSWLNWRSNTTLTAGQLVGGDLQGTGDYQFRSRLENSSTLKTTRWSVPATVTVSPRLSSVAVFHETESGNAELPDCIGPSGTANPAPSCVWSEEILPDGDLKVVVLTTRNGRWRTGIV